MWLWSAAGFREVIKMDLFIFAVELIGTFAFAASGAMRAVSKRMDAFGVVMLGVITATGGGVMRDVILGIHPPAAFEKPLYAALAAASSALFFFPFVRRRLYGDSSRFERVLFWMDSLGLGAFTVTGISAALAAGGESGFLLISLGVMTGTGGGVLRDLLAGSTPYIFTKEIYACASIAGGIIYLSLYSLLGEKLSGAAAIGAVVMIRYLAVKFRWNLPTFFEG